MSKYEFLDRRVPIEEGNIAIVQDLSKCKNCSLCRKACAVDMGVFDYYDLTTNGDHPICIHFSSFTHPIFITISISLAPSLTALCAS